MIERLYVHNYRCLENFTLDLKGKGSALLIGKNGSGKSTVRQALAILQRIGRGPGRVRDCIGASDFTQYRTHVPMRFEVDVVLSSRKLRYDLAVTIPESDQSGQPRVLEESLSEDGQPVFTRRGGMMAMAGSTGFEFDDQAIAIAVLGVGDDRNAMTRLRSYLSSMILLAPVPAQISGYSAQPTLELKQSAENFASCLSALLLRHPAAYRVLESYLGSVLPDFESFENVSQGERGAELVVKFSSRANGGSMTVDFRRLSDGEKCFFLAAYIVSLNQFAGRVFCFWDEPDNHLSLPEVQHFVVHLRRMANKNGQFVATSHHPQVIRSFSDENTFVLTRNSHLEPTLAQPLSDHKYDGDLINALIRDEVIG